MEDYRFERECRTANSECYAITNEGSPIGRVDLHFTFGSVHATLCINESLTQETIQEIIESVDEDIVDAVGIARDNFVVHVFQGRETGVFTEDEFSEDGHDH